MINGKEHDNDIKDVFISYSSKDLVEVNEIIRLLEKENISYWKAPEMIPIGSNYAKEIPRVITGCKVFLLIISNNSQNSIWVEKEIDFAINNKKTILPVKISGGNMSDIFSFYLNNVQMIYYTDGKRKAQDLLVIRLKSLISEQKKLMEADWKSETYKNENNASQNNNSVNNASKYYNPDVDLENGDYSSGTGKNEKDERVQNLRDRMQNHGFGLNPQPIVCKYCNGKLKMVGRGIYECQLCRRENYDYYRTIRNYLERHGPSSKYMIHRATGVPKESIEYFFQQEMLEIPMASNVRMRCRKCGLPIRTGIYCERCK